MENILSNYEISPARYHGGKLNGVDCRAFMSKANEICSEILAMLLSVDHPQRCSDENIIDRCNIEPGRAELYTQDPWHAGTCS